jgi:reactive intermediate/imine deaminase
MHRRRVVAVLVVVLGAGAAFAGAAENRSYVRPSLPSGDGPPFSGAVRVGNTLYVSGDIGLTENQKVPDDAKAEARLLLERFKRTLGEAGFTMDDLVYVTVFCSDVKHYADWNEVYRAHFKKEFPARAFIGSGRLLFDARFEMQGIAVKR